MRRRRSRNRSDSTSTNGLFGRLPRLVLIVLLLLAVAEWGASIVLARLDASGKAVPWSDKDLARLYDTDQPGVYRQVLIETPPVRDGAYAPFVEYRPAPRRGVYVSVTAQGLRGGPAGESGPRVVVFGGAGVFGQGLPDAETIPAVLAGALERAGKPARVENHGVPGWYSSQDRIAFAQMLAGGDRPDVAVFLHGLEDFLQCGQPERSRWSGRLAEGLRPVGVETLVRQSALARLSRRLLGTPEAGPTDGIDPACAADAQVEASLARLDNNRRLLAAMAERFGVKAVFAQQPVPTYHYDNARRAVPAGPDQMAPYIATAKGYARLAEMRGTGRLWEQDLMWLADLELAEGNAYAGIVQYSPAFARLIAETLAQRVAALLPVPPAAAPVAQQPPQ